MTRLYLNRYLILMLFIAFNVSAEQKKSDVVISDGNIKITKGELMEAVKYWPAGKRSLAAEYDGDRYDLLTQMVINKKVSKLMQEMNPEANAERFWQREFAIRNLDNKLFFDNFKKDLEVPDMTALAEEEYLVNKSKYTKKPEERKGSHIFIKCFAGSECDREEKKILANNIIKKLENGESYEKLVEEYSDDPGSKERKGKLKHWVELGGNKMDGYFVEGLFSIEEVGDISDIVETKFGLHIIRLDGIKPISYKSKTEVLPQIISALEAKYRSLSQKSMIEKLRFGEQSYIDDEIVTKILEPYLRNKELIIEKPTSNKKISK